jgi:hypothetical protein
MEALLLGTIRVESRLHAATKVWYYDPKVWRVVQWYTSTLGLYSLKCKRCGHYNFNLVTGVVPLPDNKIAILDNNNSKLIILDHKRFVVTNKLDLVDLSVHTQYIISSFDKDEVLYYDHVRVDIRILNLNTLESRHCISKPFKGKIKSIQKNDKYVCVRIDNTISVYDKSFARVHTWHVSSQYFGFGIDSEDRVYMFKANDTGFDYDFDVWVANVNSIGVFMISGAWIKRITFKETFVGHLNLYNDVLYLKRKDQALIGVYSLDGTFLGELNRPMSSIDYVHMCHAGGAGNNEIVVMEDDKVVIY